MKLSNRTSVVLTTVDLLLGLLLADVMVPAAVAEWQHTFV
jgi:hypothetical protein